MVGLPGYTLVEPFQACGSHLCARAIREADQRKVLLKTPRTEHPGPRERARFEHELGLLRRLEGIAGVCSTLGLVVHQGRPVLVLQDVEGAHLSEQVGAPVPARRVLELASGLAATLAEVHRRGVIHQAVQPASILLTPEGVPWLVDFSSATLQQGRHPQALPPHVPAGMPAYMSPEQSGRMNRTLDSRTDLYSLGITLYQLLTGGFPFQAGDALEWIHAHLAQVPLPPHLREPSVPPMLSALILKLIAKVPEERYQSAEGLLADLRICLSRLADGEHAEFPLGTQDFPLRIQPPQRLYGRDEEVRALASALERVARLRRSEWLLVRGYSGIGKSSVAHSVHPQVLRRRGFFLSGKFDQLQRDVPYATLAQAFHGLVQQLLTGSDAEVESWRQRLLEAFEGLGQVVVALVPGLEAVAGKQPPVSVLPPLEAQNRFHRTFQRFLSVFATPERPLVLFLDDLQWADSASLELLKFLATHPDTPPLLWVGAYRDNEVGATHPLARALEEIRQAGTRLGDIPLGPLAPEQTWRLVADALPGTPLEVARALGAVLQAKTGGNPFFLLQVLQTLYQDGLLVRAPQGGWRWDEAGVRAKAYSDNVLDFIAGRLRLLPEPTQRLLCQAACVGNAFSASTLALLGGLAPNELEAQLEPALQEEVAVRAGSEGYRFLHDRIQQAALALLPEAERKAVHLRIGRLLLASLTQEQLRERLFDVVAQLNAGAELMGEGEERLRLARLNAEAGWKALASAAWHSAVGYFSIAFSLFPCDPWEAEHSLVFSLRLDQARCELMAGRPHEARRYVDELRTRARTPPERAAAYRLQSTLHLAAGEVESAVDCLLECLKRLGMPMPAHPTARQVKSAEAEVWALLGARPIESLAELPPMEDDSLRAVMGVLADLTVPALYAGGSLLPFHLCRMVALTLRHGNTGDAAHAYAWYGLMCCVATAERYEEGHAFGCVAHRLVSRPEFSAHRSGVLFILAHLSRWVRPLSVSLQLFQETFTQALQGGDFRNACYCCDNILFDHLLLGRALEEVYRDSVERLEFVRKASYGDIGSIITVYQRHVQQLRGLSVSMGSLDGEGFSEKEYEARLASREQPLLACVYFITKAKARFLGGAPGEAREALARAAKSLQVISGLIARYEYELYSALALAACLSEAPTQQQKGLLRTLRRHHQQLAIWARHGPENFLAAERMVAAELARVTGRTEEAMRTYEEALRTAREHGLLPLVALAAELAARFSHVRGAMTAASAYAREAWLAYRQWGAEGKQRQLEVMWPRVAAPNEAGAGALGPSHLDVLSLVKAQQAISREIVQERLVATLMRVTLQSAGAQRGALLLRQGELLKVAAVSDGTGTRTREPHAALPWTLLAYVRRTGEPVLIGDTSRSHAFSSDAELLRRQARSVLCLPLCRNEELQGALYLENSLTPEAFSSERVALLGHLASQAAISIENARLYEDIQRAEAALRQANEELELRVEERTRELTQTQAQLVETARIVGMAEVATNVLHDVGNALTSITADMEVMRRAAISSRLGRIKQVARLLEEHREDLPGFFTQDPRGSHLVDYISSLAEELAQERVSLQQTLQELSVHVSQVRDIILLQRAYARSPRLPEECALEALVEEALRLQQGALRRTGVQVTREVAPLPRVKVHRYRVLQILCNLLGNACQALEAVPEGSRHLVVRLEARGAWARIQVRDSGEGISPELKARLFTLGFTTRAEGHGSGLHSSALAAELLGGRLALESEGLNQGATATLELPLPQLQVAVAQA